MELLDTKIDVSVLQLLTAHQAWHFQVVPFQKEGNCIKVFICRESIERDDSQKKEIEILLNKKVDFIEIEEHLLKQLLNKYYRKLLGSSGARVLDNISFNSSENIEEIILESKLLNSSDIHFEPYENEARIRFRIDGKLIVKYSIPIKNYPSVVNRIKILSELDISERRLPQDGRIQFRKFEEDFDIRVSCLPTMYGEKLVLRILNRNKADVDLNLLGMNGSQISIYKEVINSHSGIILISGPTGSGKTTTLYATLKQLNKSDNNILTVEDPIEYYLKGINQVQLKEEIGLTFPVALKSFLRQDPDIIMLGEIRDTETAEMAFRASLTGHLVFSTVHTNSAWGIIVRLLNMGIPMYLINSTIKMVIAQRLVRLLCSNCKEKTDFNIDFKKDYPLPKHVYKAKGCPDCHYTGFKGRKAIYEIIKIDNEVRKALSLSLDRPDELLEKKGVSTLSQSAYRLFQEGATSFSEISSMLNEE
ncbi:MAG: GspE/PulE family protein [Hyphomicrobiales bacterium]